jgi:nitroimidazol reductase NimA-like FMN-containing flavoprotein (pyridoxamine 5'-phosphate oxidase superfamily)
MTAGVKFRELSKQEIDEVLSRNSVGRIAFSLRDRVDIEPIHYVHEDGWLYGRTSEGEKLSKVRHNQWIAFEVDEVSAMFDWRSVVVHGSLWILQRGNPHADTLWEQALERVSRIVPNALTRDDPVRFRQILFRIAVNEARGRMAAVEA